VGTPVASPTVKIQISNGQYWLMAIALVLPIGHFIFLHLAMAFAGRTTWLSLLVATFLGCGILYVHGKLAAGAAGQSLINFTKQLLGPWLGIPVGLLFILFFLLAGAITLNEFELFWGSAYPKTLNVLFPILMVAVALGVVYAGLEVAARLIQLLLPVLFLIGIVVSLLILKDKDMAELLPLLYHGMLPVWQGAWILVAMFSELVVLLTIAEHVKEPQKLPRQGFLMMGAFTVLFLGPVTGPLMVFGEPLAQAFTYPTLAEIQYIAYTNVLERIDLLGLFLLTLGSFLRLCLFLLATAVSIGHLIAAPNYRLYVVPTALLLLALTFLITTTREETSAFLTIAYPVIAVGVGVGLPLLLGAISLIRSLTAPKGNTGQPSKQKKVTSS